MLIKTIFNDFVSLNRGFDLPDSDIVEGEYPVVASTNIKAYHNKYKIEPPVVVTGRSGSLGRVQYINEKCWPLNTSLYSKDFKGNYPLYVYYYLQTMRLEQYNAGAGVPTLNQNHLQKLKIKIHPVGEQKRVANVLSKYDELIEVNNQRIKKLEQTAEELYKEWFVRFRFPNWQNTEFENGIPKGWSKCTFGDIIEFQNGFAFKSDDFKNGGKYKIITIKNVQQDGFDSERTDSIDFIPNRMPNYCKLNDGDVLMSLTGNVGRVCIVHGQNFLLNQRVAKIKSDYPSYVYYMLRNEIVFCTLNNIAYGTAQLNLSPILASRLKIIVPSKQTLRDFEAKVSPIIKKIITLSYANDNLIKQRDYLLPRLMSGKLEV